MDSLHQTQIFYEIAMSIGNSRDLGGMLKEGLSAYLKKLNCSAGVVLEMRRAAGGAVSFSPIFSIPRNLSPPVCQVALENIPGDLAQSSLSEFLSTLPVSGQDNEGRFFHLMELPGFGLLLLFKCGKDFPPCLLMSLGSLNRKLADSCLACRQNMKIESTNELLIKEIDERMLAEAKLKITLEDLELRVEERTRELKTSNEALTDINRQLNDIVEFLPDATCVIGDNDRVIAWNRAMEEMSGVRKEDMIGKEDYAGAIPFYGKRRLHLSDLLDRGDADLEATYKDLKRKGAVLTAEAYVPCVYDGKGAHVFVASAPLFDAQGERVGAIESIRNITEQKEAEEALRRSEAKYRELVENANSIILRRDRTGNVTFFNEFAQRFFGYSEQEILGKNVLGTIVPLLESVSGRDLKKMIEDIGRDPGPYATNINENMRRNGDRVWIAWHNKAILSESGEVSEVLCIGNDITERKREQDELFSSRHMLRSVLDNIPQRVFWKDRNSIFAGCNKSFAMDRGYEDPDELIGKSTHEIHSLATVAEVCRADDLEVMETRRAKLNYEEFYVKADGRRCWLSTSKVPMFSQDGQVTGVLGIYRDITEGKTAQEALSESEARYRGVIENMRDVFYRTDERGVVVMVSPSAVKLLGYDCLEEMLGKHVGLYWMYPEQRQEMLRSLREAGVVRDYEVTIKKRDGSPVAVSVTSTFRQDDHGNILGIEGVIRDITERKQAEGEHTRLVAAIGQAAEGIVIIDKNWTVDYVNPAIERISGFDRSEIIGRHLSVLECPKNDRTVYADILNKLGAGRIWSDRLTNMRKDGSFYEVELTASPIRNNSSAVIGYVGIYRDITRQVKLEKELQQAKKMEAIGTLAGGIAHDFNNILAAIVGYTEIAQFKIARDNPIRSNLDQVLSASRRAADLIRQILAFSRRTEQVRQPLRIDSIVAEALKLLHPSLPATIEIRQDIAMGPDRGVILADPTEIHQVFMNLCTNAAHSMRARGGVLSVSLRDMIVDDSLYPDLEAGPYVCLSVKDTGQGIDSVVMERIFDPFFTTKGVGEGTGLGLSVVQGIVKAYGGAITVESEPGRGASFNVFFPALEIHVPEQGKTCDFFQSGSERILFVDDEETLVEMAREILESLGYTVVAETDSLKALEAFRADPQGFALVITDMTMPNLRGDQLAREIMTIRPGVPIILCTGYSELMDEKQARETGISELVTKPYGVASFAATIRKVLNR